MDEIIKNIELKTPRNCEITWKFNQITSKIKSWSRLGWRSMSDYPEVKELIEGIEELENKYYSCMICGGQRRGGFGINAHHLIPNNNSIHPTDVRILEDVTVGICSSCHGANGGFLHTKTDEELKEYELKKEEIEKKLEHVGKLLDEIDKMSMKYEVEFVKKKLNEIIQKRKEFDEK